MYFVGFFTRFGVMSTLTQMWVLVVVIAVSSSFSLLITINRALAVSVGMSDRTKKLVLQLFFAEVLVQLVLLVVVGLTIENHNEEGRKICLKLIKVYPKEMDTMNGVNLVLSGGTAMVAMTIYMTLGSFIYTLVTSVCVTILVRNIREQAKSSQSAQFLANQRRLTVGVFSFMTVEFVGLIIPMIILTICSVFETGSLVVQHFTSIIMAVYPACGSYLVLMSNTEYRNRINSIFRRGQKVTTLSSDQADAQTNSIPEQRNGKESNRSERLKALCKVSAKC